MSSQVQASSDPKIPAKYRIRLSPRNALDPGAGCCLHRGGRAEYAGLG